jgi:membrane protease YdiL (CAAX protease family)
MQTIPGSPKRLTLIIGILLLFGTHFALPYATNFCLRNMHWVTDYQAASFWTSRYLYWVSLVILYAYAVEIEKQKLLLYEEKKYKFFVYVLSVIGIFLALFVGLFLIANILLKLGMNKESIRFDKIMDIFRSNHLLIIFTCLTAGIAEEVIYRGYLMSRLEIIFKSPVVSIFLSSILFGLMHYGYGTIIQIIAPFFIGLVFAYYYWEFRNIKVIILCHFMWDMMAIYARL